MKNIELLIDWPGVIVLAVDVQIPMRLKANRQALRVSLIYVGVAAAWILFSDELLKRLVPAAETRVTVSIFKGWAFVLATGGLLYLSLRRILGKWEQVVQQLRSTETELVKARAHLRNLLETSSDGIHVINEAGELVEANSAFYQMLGYPPENPPALKVADWDAQWTAAELGKRMQLILATPALFETIHRRRDGTFITVEVSARRIDINGQRCLYASSREISARKLAEERLRENEERYRQLFQLESDAIILADRETHRVLDVNQSAERLYGYSREEFLKLQLEDVSAEPEKSRQSIQANETHVAFRWHRKKDGECFAVEITVSNFEHQGRTLKLGAVRDITTRKLAEEKLRESEEKFSKIFQSSPMPVSLSSMKEGRYLDANEEFLRVLGRSRDEVVGHTAVEIGVWPDAGRRAAMVAKVEADGAVRNLEIDVRRANGEIRQVLWSAEAVIIGGQRCLLGTSMDITDRKLAERNQRESEERYRQLFELESDAVVLIDCETHRFVDVNQSAQRLYGYGRDEFLQMTVERVSEEPEKTRMTVGSGTHFVPLRWHRKKNGERFALEITTNTITHQGRRTELATLRDITARQQVMDMLSETTEQLLEAQQVAGLGSYVFDMATGLWTGSEVLGEIFGIPDPGTSRDVGGWIQIVHPQDRAEMEIYLRDEVLCGRMPFDRVYRIVRPKDQQERWVHGFGKLIMDERGQVSRMVGVIQDITQRQQAEEQMHLQFSALSAAANAIVITDRDGKIEWANPAFSKLTGYDVKEAIGKNPRVLKSGQHPPDFYANLWKTVVAGDFWHGEIVNRRKDGQLYTENMTITPVRGADGQIAHFVAIKQDVTEQRRLEKQVQQSQKMEAIGTLAGGIAHDFNNILASMFGYAYLLQQDTDGNPAAQESVAEILKATGRAKDLVQQILTFSRQREQKPRVVQLDTIVKEAIRFLRASLPAQIKIELNLAPDVPSVLADPTQIYQVAINLATNAFHAMEGQPGKLAVSLESFQPDQDFIQSHSEFRPVRYARLVFADTGHGMDAKTLERMFEPFFTTKPVGKGTGLGLAVVHGIVQAHNGIITVESQLGRGTTFRICFPGETETGDLALAPEGEMPCGAGERILLLDDERALTGALERLLERLNYRITACNTPAEAIRRLEQDPTQFDLVITDLTMPEMTGLEVARQLHRLRPDLPVILASGFCADLNSEGLKAAGICDVIEKPVSRNVLAQAISRALAARIRQPERPGIDS